MSRSSSVHMLAPAKVNLVLQIQDRLPNGYHRLWSFMHGVDVMDRLSLQELPADDGIRLIVSPATTPQGPDNLVYRAAAMVLERAPRPAGVEIHLEKHIPMAAGLGGGSSDAAATIVGLNHLLNLQWSAASMAALGAQLGSDVPFFFSLPSAVVRGWGEEVVPCAMENTRWVVLVNPGFPIDTGWAYAQVAQSRRDGLTTIHEVPETLSDIQAGAVLQWEAILPFIRNDFEEVLMPEFPRLGEIRSTLLACGAEAALLSGSGATVFGVFRSPGDAASAAETLRRQPECTVIDAPFSSQGLALVAD